MDSVKKLAFVLLPDTQLAKEVIAVASSWVDSGLISEFVYSTPALLGAKVVGDHKIMVTNASEGISGTPFDLLQQLGRSQPDRVEVVYPWILGNVVPDGAVIDSASQVTDVLRASLSERIDPASGRAIRPLATVSMALYPFHSDFGDEAANVAAKIKSDLIVVCSPEVRAQPWAASAPLQEDNKFAPFAVAQISAVCGLWSGFSDSIFSIIDDESDQLNVAQPLVIRTIGSVVVAEGVAERIVLEALKTSADPTVSPFTIASEASAGRPQAISAAQSDLIKAELEKYFQQVLNIVPNGFSYDGLPRDLKIDQTRGFLDAIKKFGIFAGKAAKSIPMFMLHGLMNFGSTLANKILGQVRPAHPDIYSGLDQEVLDLQDQLLKNLADDEKMSQNAASTASFKQQPELWREVRRIALSAIDGGVGNAGNSVLPLVENIFPNLKESVDVDEAFAEFVPNGNVNLNALEIYNLQKAIPGMYREIDAEIQALHIQLSGAQDPNAPEYPSQAAVTLEQVLAAESQVSNPGEADEDEASPISATEGEDITPDGSSHEESSDEAPIADVPETDVAMAEVTDTEEPVEASSGNEIEAARPNADSLDGAVSPSGELVGPTDANSAKQSDEDSEQEIVVKAKRQYKSRKVEPNDDGANGAEGSEANDVE